MSESSRKTVLLDAIRRHANKINETDAMVEPDTDLIDDLDFDSVQVLEICSELEDELDITIPVNRLADIRTAGQFADLLAELEAQS